MTEKFSIVYADPPWQYDDKCHAGKRGAGYKYSTMSLDEIKQLPIQAHAADDATLFLWATFPMIREAFSVIPAWGFEYKTIGFLWVKTNPKRFTFAWGMGNWTRSNAEPCLLATRGNPKRIDAGIHSVVIRPRLRHSQKPPEIRHQIVKLCGNVPRVELFAREKSEGWSAWGNEIGNDIELSTGLS